MIAHISHTETWNKFTQNMMNDNTGLSDGCFCAINKTKDSCGENLLQNSTKAANSDGIR